MWSRLCYSYISHHSSAPAEQLAGPTAREVCLSNYYNDYTTRSGDIKGLAAVLREKPCRARRPICRNTREITTTKDYGLQYSTLRMHTCFMRMQKWLRHAVVHIEIACTRYEYVFIKRAYQVVFAVTTAARSGNRIAIIFEKLRAF